MSFNSQQLQDTYIRNYLEALDCPRSLTAFLLYTHNEHKQLTDLSFDPISYNTLTNAQNSLAATKFLSKAVFLKTGNDLRETALLKFFEAEERCKETNRRIREISKHKHLDMATCITYMQHKISSILGEFPTIELFDSANWGPGATASIKRVNATHAEKFQTETGISTSAYALVKDALASAYPNWDLSKVVLTDYNRIVTVPKNAKTDRVIAIEPGLNIWFQKAVGAIIRRKLRHIGIDLNDQMHNQKKSRLAAKFNKLATVDFSSASDTISYELVKELLPPRWWHVLSSLRSVVGKLDGKTIPYDKFSSMGNGFTFELETLIFYSLAAFCCNKSGSEFEINVYGDDVILPSSAFDTYSKYADLLGFTVNSSKSYSTTYYRESCGAHWWNGTDIKPIFLKENLDERSSVVKAANSLRMYSHIRGFHSFCDIRFMETWCSLAEYLGPKQPRIPAGYGDIGLIVNFDEQSSATRPRHGLEGFCVKLHLVQMVQRQVDHQGLHLFKLKSIEARTFDSYGVSSLSADGNFIPILNRQRYVKKRVTFQRWSDLGPWL